MLNDCDVLLAVPHGECQDWALHVFEHEAWGVCDRFFCYSWMRPPLCFFFIISPFFFLWTFGGAGVLILPCLVRRLGRIFSLLGSAEYSAGCLGVSHLVPCICSEGVVIVDVALISECTRLWCVDTQALCYFYLSRRDGYCAEFSNFRFFFRLHLEM